MRIPRQNFPPGDESVTSSARPGSKPEEKKSPLLKFLKVMEFTGFLPVTWLPATPEMGEEQQQQVFVKVTFGKTLIVSFVDFLVVLGKLFIDFFNGCSGFHGTIEQN